MTPDIERDAEVTERDKAIALRFWAAYGTPLLRALLAALRMKPRA